LGGHGVVLGVHGVQQARVDADPPEHREDVRVLALVVVGQLHPQIRGGPLERPGAGGVAVRQLLERGRQAVQVAAHGAVDDAVHREVGRWHGRRR
jgi:hypothetical protein